MLDHVNTQLCRTLLWITPEFTLPDKKDAVKERVERLGHHPVSKDDEKSPLGYCFQRWNNTYMAPKLWFCKSNACFLWYFCLMRPWKQGLPRWRRNYHASACRASAQLNTLQVSKFGTWHYSAVLFEVLLPQHCDWPHPLQHKASLSILSS